MSPSDRPRPSLELVGVHRWQLGSRPEELEVAAATGTPIDPARPLWIQCRAPLPRRGREANEASQYTEALDHSRLLELLDSLELPNGGSHDPTRVRLDALRNEELWQRPKGLWTPGIHIGHGVVTASAVASVKDDTLRIAEAKVAVLLGSMSFVVLPGCMVSIAWRPRFVLRGAPTKDQLRGLLELLDTTQLVHVETYKTFRDRVATTWTRYEQGGQAGDLAVAAIGCLLDSAIPAMHDIRERLNGFEYGLLPEPARHAAQDQAGRANAEEAPAISPAGPVDGATGLHDFHSGFRDFHRAVDMLLRDICPLVSDTRTEMLFVGDERSVDDLRGRYASTVDDLVELKGNIRDAVASISAATSATLLAVARRQQVLAEAEAGRRRTLDLLAAILAPALVWAAVYGASVWLPGEGHVEGTAVLVGLMLVSILLAAGTLHLLPGQRRALDAPKQAAIDGSAAGS